MTFALRQLADEDLLAAQRLLAAACAWDRADVVAAEKLFAAAPVGPAMSWGAEVAGELVGVAAMCADRIRVLAVAPSWRGRGAGTALLQRCEQEAWEKGLPCLRTMDQAGNYLSPGIDKRNAEAIEWLKRRGYEEVAFATNLVVDVRTNPLVSQQRADDLARAAFDCGYRLRRAGTEETSLLAAIAAEFNGAWAWEVERALAVNAVHVAETLSGEIAGFAAHDGNNRGLGWFGPAGTWPQHRGRGLGQALLMACLVDVAHAHAACEIAWIGPRRFYEQTAGGAGERSFVVLSKRRESGVGEKTKPARITPT